MAHQLEQAADGRTAFFSARVDPWHKLGTITTEAQNAEDALRIAHLDWEVTKQPLTTTLPGQEGTILVPGRYATVRRNPFTDEPEALGVVGEDYTVVQNAENAEFLDAIVAESGAHFETAGSLRGGRQVFLTMKAPEGLLIGGEDAVDQYLVATNSHDGTTAFKVAITPTRVVCANTLRMGLRGAKATFSTRHTSGATGRVEEAQQALGVMWDYSKHFEEQANHMLATPISDAAFDAAVEKFFTDEKAKTERQERDAQQRMAEVQNLYHDSPTLDGVRGSMWGAYNAVTEYVDWKYPVRGDEVARAERIARGGWIDKVKQDAFRAFSRA